MTKAIQIWYHANCNDGQAAAFVCWLYFEHYNALSRWGGGDRAISYIPVTYNEPPPPFTDDDEIFLVDFCYPLEVMRSLPLRTTVIDHHADKSDVLSALGGINLFDTAHSGAVLTWKYFFPNEEIPLFLQYVEDRDLWRKQLPHSAEIYAAMRSHQMSGGLRFGDNWKQWLNLLDDKFLMGPIVAIGMEELARRDRVVQARADDFEWVVLPTPEGGSVHAPIAYAPEFWSDVCHELLDRHPRAIFALAWRDEGGKLKLDIRSRKNGQNCIPVAKHYGGGGHFNASGFPLASPLLRWIGKKVFFKMLWRSIVGGFG